MVRVVRRKITERIWELDIVSGRRPFTHHMCSITEEEAGELLDSLNAYFCLPDANGDMPNDTATQS